MIAFAILLFCDGCLILHGSLSHFTGWHNAGIGFFTFTMLSMLFSDRDEREAQRVSDYNAFIQIEIAWQQFQVTDEVYQSARANYYTKHPNGDTSY